MGSEMCIRDRYGSSFKPRCMVLFVVLYVAQYGQQLHHSLARLKWNSSNYNRLHSKSQSCLLKSKHQRGTAAPGYTGYTEKRGCGRIRTLKIKTNPKQCFTKKIELGFAQYGGPGGIRTLDLSDANRTLSQLSYRPMSFRLDKCTSFLPKSQGGNADFVCKRRTYPVTYEFIL